MATNEEELKPLDLENTRAEQEQEDLKRAAQTDKVVRGVNGSLVPTGRCEKIDLLEFSRFYF
jgi:hypothetical protein